MSGRVPGARLRRCLRRCLPSVPAPLPAFGACASAAQLRVPPRRAVPLTLPHAPLRRPPPLCAPRRPCSADAQGVMQYMQQVQAAGLDPDDPLSSYMLQARRAALHTRASC